MKSQEVTSFLTALDHPLKTEILLVRDTILKSNPQITENIKWNGPNFLVQGEDRITMKIQPPTSIQLIFHRGAKKLTEPKKRLIADDGGLLDWKSNDRAVLTFKTKAEIVKHSEALKELVNKWLMAST